MTARVGFIGLGTMGGPMATNLAKASVPLAVYNICTLTWACSSAPIAQLLMDAGFEEQDADGAARPIARTTDQYRTTTRKGTLPSLRDGNAGRDGATSCPVPVPGPRRAERSPARGKE